MNKHTKSKRRTAQPEDHPHTSKQARRDNVVSPFEDPRSIHAGSEEKIDTGSSRESGDRDDGSLVSSSENRENYLPPCSYSANSAISQVCEHIFGCRTCV